MNQYSKYVYGEVSYKFVCEIITRLQAHPFRILTLIIQLLIQEIELKIKIY